VFVQIFVLKFLIFACNMYSH